MSEMMDLVGVEEIVELATLNVDPTYQRLLKSRHKKIANEFDPRAAGVLRVCRRPDKSLWLVDGLQRRGALMRLGYTHWRALVIDSIGPEFEARLFVMLNGGYQTVTLLTSRELFGAQVTARDPVALATVVAVETAGLKLAASGAKGWPYISSLKLMYRCTKQYGQDNVHKAMRLIAECWPGNEFALREPMLMAMVYIVGNYQINEKTLISKFRKINPVLVLQNALIAAGYTSRWAATYRYLISVYNRRLKEENRLPDLLVGGERQASDLLNQSDQ